MSWHNTYFVVLYNWTNSRWNIVDLEDPGWGTIIIEPMTSRQVGGKVFPWCADDREVLNKAYRFNQGGDPNSGGGATRFYLYQDYGSRKISSLSPGGTRENRLRAVAETVNVFLRPSDDAGNWDQQVEVIRST